MRASRLLSILMTLQTRGRMTAEALAREFEVSMRTIYRDIDHLSQANVPVYADRGPGGGFQLLDGYRTKLAGLSPAEAETLFLAGLPGPAAELGLAQVLATAQLKLTAALPESARATARRVSARFHLDPVGWFRSKDQALLLPTIAKAVWNEMCLEVRYKRGERWVARRLKPLGLVLKAGIWYLVAEAGEQIRTYRVANILQLSLTDDRFQRPKDFDLVRFWTDAASAYESGLFRATATLRLSPTGLAKLDLLGSAVAEAAFASAGPVEADGRVRAVIPIESIDQAAADLIRLGAEAEALEPPILRDRIAEMALDLWRLYRDGAAGSKTPAASSSRPRRKVTKSQNMRKSLASDHNG
ncbi:MAG: YafY family transcriptional regulator [Proteobacteria bacterium]|nr:YafY family transcriptional regulator [Pseudomonadota bacterium]MBI3500151.1 YafY family transcriptional regulator [Pseudomonadota bacterium]